MRLWSLHPKYLDPIGLARLFNEGKGGLRALYGLQTMHRNHPQLDRFKDTADPISVLSEYLWEVHDHIPKERLVNGRYDTSLLSSSRDYIIAIPVTTEQIEFERKWMYQKCSARTKKFIYPGRDLHPLFYEIPGKIEPWEKSA